MNGDPERTAPEALVVMSDETTGATQHSAQISPVFGDIAAKMELAAKKEIQRL
jgi:hypothetical protein